MRTVASSNGRVVGAPCSEPDLLRVVETYGRTGYWHIDLRSQAIRFSNDVCAAHGMPQGYRPESLQECIGWYHPDDQARVSKIFQQAASEGEKITYQARLLNAKKEVRWVEVYGEARLNEAGEPVMLIGTMSDVTDERANSARLNEALRRAQRADRLKDTFLANMSHELRTPLNAIIGFSQVIQMMQERGRADEKVGEYATDIANAGQHLLSIIEDIFSVAELEAEGSDAESGPCMIGDIMDDVRALTSVRARDQKRQIFFEGKDCASAQILANKPKVEKVLLNLVSNAMKFSPPSKPVRVDANLERDNRVLIRVTDEGPGIPEAQQHKIFERFERLEASNLAIEGVGVGLSIAHDLMTSMGGEIGVDSIEGKGSTFWISFPVCREAELALAG